MDWTKHPDMTDPGKVMRTSTKGISWILIAAAEGHVSQLNELIHTLTKSGLSKEDVAAHINPSGITPLWIASQNGHADVVELLIKVGTKLNQADKSGITPLHIATFMGHVDVVKALINAGAALDQADKNGTTPLWIAAQNNQLEIMNMLLQMGADIEQENIKKQTLPFFAIDKNSIEMVKILIL